MNIQPTARHIMPGNCVRSYMYQPSIHDMEWIVRFAIDALVIFLKAIMHKINGAPTES